VTTIYLTQSNTSPSHRVDQVVDCGMLVHSSSMAVQRCWILAGTGTHCCIRRSRASQTCSMGNMSGEYTGRARTGMFQLSGIVYRSLHHGAVHYHAEHEVMLVDERQTVFLVSLSFS